ncbi:MAG TPA: hypothetical protein VGZ22_17715 [Isosphaeraceae bacterium]|jgi:hypothetical protein|nr:hypothetical protein [Isosphaeraceae bacterium]
MAENSFNKYRAAIQILQRGRDVLVDDLANEVLDQAEDLCDGGFTFNEFLEAQGTRLHFLSLLVTQLEQSAELLDEANAPPAPVRRRKARSRKLERQPSTEESTGDT